MVAPLPSHTSAHNFIATVAPFRAWRGLRLAVAKGPERVTITWMGDYRGFDCYLQQKGCFNKPYLVKKS